MGFIQRLKNRRRNKKALRELSVLSSTFHTFEKIEKDGLISFDQKSRRLFIEEPLAVVMMVTADIWQNFLRNCFYWLYYRQCSEAWDSFILKEELAAVRQASKKYTLLTKADVQRIRRGRRDEIAQGDMEPPKVEPFEFFVVRTSTKADATEKAVPGGEVIVVGNYSPESGLVEIAAWEDVERFLKVKS